MMFKLLTVVFMVCLATSAKGDVCPDGVPIVNCFADPCQVTDCPNYPNAECRADFCGGCNARFYDGNTEVTDSCNSA